jgi:tetratricopeptide (TPR) repeat protein
MTAKLVTHAMRAAVLFLTIVCAYGQTGSDSTDLNGLIKEGKASLLQNRLHEAAERFQKAVDLNPSLAEAHEGLGMALSREVMAGNVRPSNDLDVAKRAESHLKEAIDLSPSAPAPLIQLSMLEATLAERAIDASERSDRYRDARDSLKRVMDLQPGNARLYLHLANLERDEFAPPIQQAKAQFGKDAGPISDSNLRNALQKQYGGLIKEAIANAKRASELNGRSSQPLLLLSKILRERALIRNTPEQYTADMRSSDQWRLQFLAVGGHLDQEEPAVDH